ncbi:MAG: protease complex subunit PrcB family protein [Chloroflexota bacterium]|nr:protease complex subunit PrcB family protein [Chloroflexota bacterium]
MNNIKHVFLPLLIFLIGCAKEVQQDLPYKVIEDSVAFPTTEKDINQIDDFVVITKFDDITQLELNEQESSYFDEINFNNSFVILVLRGQLPDSGTVESVIKEENDVIIRTKGIDPGPGSFVISGFTPPYQIIMVDKIGVWNGYYNFALDREGTGLVSTKSVFVP